MAEATCCSRLCQNVRMGSPCNLILASHFVILGSILGQTPGARTEPDLHDCELTSDGIAKNLKGVKKSCKVCGEEETDVDICHGRCRNTSKSKKRMSMAMTKAHNDCVSKTTNERRTPRWINNSTTALSNLHWMADQGPSHGQAETDNHMKHPWDPVLLFANCCESMPLSPHGHERLMVGECLLLNPRENLVQR